MAAAPKTTIYVGGVPYTAATQAKAEGLATKKGADLSSGESTTAPAIYGSNGQIVNGGTPTPTAPATVTQSVNGRPVATTTGTMTANISTPAKTNATVPAPVVVTSSAAQKDFNDKKAQTDQLQADTNNHQQLTQAQTTPVAPVTTGTTAPEPKPQQNQPTVSPYSGSDAGANLNDQINTLLNGLNSSDSNIDADTTAQLTPLQQEQAKAQADYDKQSAISLDRLTKIASGTYPLSAAEKNLISSTTATFQATIDAQNQANASYTGQMTELMASLGIATSAPTEGISLIHAAISSGQQKVADLDAQMSKAVADLQTGFQKSDYEMVSDAWKQTSDYLKERMDTIKDMQTQVTEAAKQQKQDAKDYTQMALSNVIASANFSQTEKQNAIQNAFTQQQITESQRHDMQEEAVAWTNANKHSYELKDDGTIFDTTTGAVVSAPTADASGGATTTAANGSDINQTIANIASSNKLSATTQAAINPILGVINSAQEMAQNNPGGKFGGINPLNVINDLHVPFTNLGLPFRQSSMSQSAVQNRANINGINLKVQQWASGASLTDKQTEQVERMVPTATDTDAKVKEKLNNLTNFMNDQIKASLATNGVVYSPAKVDLFNTQQSLDDIFNSSTQ